VGVETRALSGKFPEKRGPHAPWERAPRAAMRSPLLVREAHASPLLFGYC